MKSVNPAEMNRFSQQASQWFTNGKYSILKRMNPIRTSYIRKFIPNYSLRNPFHNLNILDMGCGGGYLSQSLHNLGANVTAVDANIDNITQAKLNNSKEINFICSTAEELVEDGAKFDHVCALEIIEHVNDPRQFICDLSRLTRQGGLVFLSTINRTYLSYLLTILLAENVLEWVPRNTHTWSKYVTTSEMQLLLNDAGLKYVDKMGMKLNPITKEWSVSGDCSVNYIMVARKH